MWTSLSPCFSCLRSTESYFYICFISLSFLYLSRPCSMPISGLTWINNLTDFSKFILTLFQLLTDAECLCIRFYLSLVCLKILSWTLDIVYFQFCPLCRLVPNENRSSFNGSLIRHLQVSHTLFYDDFLVSIFSYFYIVFLCWIKLTFLNIRSLTIRL